MEPFRALVGDQLPPAQRPTGYAMQSFFIAVGAVVASMLPWILTQAGVSNEGAIPDTVRYSFDIGAAGLATAMLWTVFTTRGYPPGELHGFADSTPLAEGVTPGSAANARSRGALWLGVGMVGAFLVWRFALRQELYVLCGLFGAWGAALLINGARPGAGMFATVMTDIDAMPLRMRMRSICGWAPPGSRRFSWFAIRSGSSSR